MTSMQSGSEILKTDKRGRVRTTPQRRQELLAEFDRSGLSGPKFAAITGLKYQTLAGWLHRRREQHSQNAPVVTAVKAPAVQWLETVIEQGQVAQATSGTGLVVRLPSGATLEVKSQPIAGVMPLLTRAQESGFSFLEFAALQRGRCAFSCIHPNASTHGPPTSSAVLVKPRQAMLITIAQLLTK